MPIPFPAFYHHKQSKTSDQKANNKIVFTFENVLSFILKQKTKYCTQMVQKKNRNKLQEQHVL